jgi:hypothetical protein
MAITGIPELSGVTIKVLELGITLTPQIGASLSWAGYLADLDCPQWQEFAIHGRTPRNQPILTACLFTTKTPEQLHSKYAVMAKYDVRPYWSPVFCTRT